MLVNVVAFAGQLAYWNAALFTPLAILVAATLESIAVYVAYHAHLAQLANDTALRLRLAAYGIAGVIGGLNYSHWCAPEWRPTPAAVAFALCSVLSPWLWGIHTRRASRDALMARGLVEPHAVRLGGTRWAWHPYRSARVMRHATWSGETDPAKAIGAVYPVPVKRPKWVPQRVQDIKDEQGVGTDTARKMRSYAMKAVKTATDPPAGVLPPSNGVHA